MKPSETLTQNSFAARVAFNLGLAKARTGHWAQSIAALQQALAEDPRHVKARVVLGKVYLRQAQIERARACWVEALQIDSGNADARHCLQALDAHRMPTAPPVESGDLFRVVTLIFGIAAILLLYNIQQDIRETRRAATEEVRILQREIQALRTREATQAPPVKATSESAVAAPVVSAPNADRGPIP